MYSRSTKFLGRGCALALIALAPIVLFAQSNGKSSAGANPSKWDIFAGYSYLAPRGSVTTPQLNPTRNVTANYNAINVGGLFSVAYYFNKNVGAQVEYGLHEWGDSVPGSNIGTHGNDDGFNTVAG